MYLHYRIFAFVQGLFHETGLGEINVRRRDHMPYASTRRLYNVFGRKIVRYMSYRKAKKLYNEINREMSVFESRFLKNRLNHA